MILPVLSYLSRKTLSLKRNCLLTRAPIVVMSSPKTFWQQFRRPLSLADYLFEHGYEILQTAPTDRAYHIIKEAQFPQYEDALAYAISLAEKDFQCAQ